MNEVYQKLIRSVGRLYPEGLFVVEGVRKPVVALTIDDGPSQRTHEILDILDRHDCRATFFLHTEDLERDPDSPRMIQRMLDAGHDVANHMPDPRFSIYLDPAEFAQQFKKAHETLTEMGAPPQFFRAAGGFYHAKRMLPSLQRLEYFERFIMASYLPWDTHVPMPETYARHLVKGAFPGAILVLHDGDAVGSTRLARTVRTLELLLPALQKEGYLVEPLGTVLTTGQ